MKATTSFTLNVTATNARCPIGETIGQRNTREGAIPVLSCEGACIRGEIARLAANRVGQVPGYRRACHGELFSVPDSAMASWVRDARQVVVVDGCHLKCHARIVEHLVPRDQVRSFDALAHHRKFSDRFDIDAVPETERRAVADEVAHWVLDQLQPPSTVPADATTANGDGAAARESHPSAGTEAGSACGAPEDRETSHFTAQVRELVAIGASIAANCEPCLEHHVRQAEGHGVSRADMERAVAVAKAVKEAPHQKILGLAARLTSSRAANQEDEPAARACDCKAEAPTPSAATRVSSV